MLRTNKACLTLAKAAQRRKPIYRESGQRNTMVYVLNVEGRPLMPTGRHGHVRRMLRDGKARVVRRCPFTIQLMCEGTSYTQPVHLGIDAGSKRIGVSAATEKEVLYEAEVELRNDIKELLSSRREARRSRRRRHSPSPSTPAEATWRHPHQFPVCSL